MFYMFFLSFVFFMKYDRFVYVLIGIEFLFFLLLVSYVFFLESMMFFYFLCFGIISSVVGLVLFFFVVKDFGFDKVMFYFLNIKFDFGFWCIKMLLPIFGLFSVLFFMHW